jgi:diguanylate cyclase (GGDEF)-like protein/PAS domain S-box-containing protein
MDQNFYQGLLNSMADGVYFVDLDRRVTFWNKAAERISGFSAQEIVGRNCADNILAHVDDNGKELCLHGCPLASTMEDGEVREVQVYLHHKLGHRVPVAIRSSPMLDATGKIIGAVEIFYNNSKSVDMLNEMEKLREEAVRDELTEIGNRRFADITLEKYEKTLHENNVPFGIVFVDIDHFKKVNDTWGHVAGDKVLRMVAQTLLNGLRVFDVACRWGGEEFIIIIPNVTPQSLKSMAERLRMLVEKSWVDFNGERLTVTASFGGAVSQKKESAKEVVARADTQLYTSKEAGRNRVTIEPAEDAPPP